MPEMPVLQSRPHLAAEVRPLCHRWLAPDDLAVEPVASAGFSGSPLFVVRAKGGAFVLKAFAAGTSTGRIRFVHALMRHLRARGLAEVPALLPSRDDETFVEDATGRVWEMQSLMPGEPNPAPSLPEVAAAIGLLARVHAAAAAMPENPPAPGPSPGIDRRIAQAREWLARPWATLPSGREAGQADPALGDLVRGRAGAAADTVQRGKGERAMERIAALEPRPLPRQSVLRDVWSAHVLFAPSAAARVTGLVDFHAAATDTPAVDLSRLLGSWLEAGAVEPGWWAERLEGYAVPRSDEVRRLVPFLAASGVVFGLDNWFRWVLSERRSFPSPAAVTRRIDQLLAALPIALEILADRRHDPRV